jgi:ring-1,2-phenylacetyl-CoA epoxidase subunit PaaB
MNTYEVFLKKPGKAPFEHAGSLEAPDAEMAWILARESYARRAEGSQMWLVERTHVIAVDEEFIAPNADKPHRSSDGAVVAERRRRLRAEGGS